MNKILYLVLVILIFVADQLSKLGVSEFMVRPALGAQFGAPMGLAAWFADAPARLPFTSIEILPFFNIVMVWNQGVSFGMMSNAHDAMPLILSGFSLVIAAVFVVWLFRSHSKLQSLAIAMVIAGAIGNVVDRLRFGAVIDFLDVHVAGYHWPAFNVADSSIFVGVFFLVIHAFFFDSDNADDVNA